MARPRSPWLRFRALAAMAVLVVVAAAALWPRYVAERDRAVGAARAMAEATVPPAAVARSDLEVRPTAWGWLVVFRDARVPCARTPWGCRLPTTSDAAPVFQDVFVCVEYGTARAYFIAGVVRPTITVHSHACQPIAPPP